MRRLILAWLVLAGGCVTYSVASERREVERRLLSERVDPPQAHAGLLWSGERFVVVLRQPAAVSLEISEELDPSVAFRHESTTVSVWNARGASAYIVIFFAPIFDLVTWLFTGPVAYVGGFFEWLVADTSALRTVDEEQSRPVPLGTRVVARLPGGEQTVAGRVGSAGRLSLDLSSLPGVVSATRLELLVASDPPGVVSVRLSPIARGR